MMYHARSPVDRDNDRVGVSLNELQRVITLWRDRQGQGSAEPENACSMPGACRPT